MAAVAATAPRAAGGLDLGPAQIVRAGEAYLQVPGYSVPSLAFWNGDAIPDLIVGEGGGGFDGKVRVYLNHGTPGAPQFSDYAYVVSGTADLVCPPAGCLGAFPRAAYWDADPRKDLLVGLSDGTVRLYTNTGSDAAPTFDAGRPLQVGPPGAKTDIDVGTRATPIVADWDGDGLRDLVVGGYDGFVRVFLNEGTDAAADFRAEVFAMKTGGAVYVGYRSSPVFADADGDGLRDLLSGDTEGRIWLFRNVGTALAPQFDEPVFVTAGGAAIDLTGLARSRPFACDWNADGRLDLLVGAGDGLVRLYPGLPEPATLLLAAAGLGGVAAGRLRRRLRLCDEAS